MKQLRTLSTVQGSSPRVRSRLTRLAAPRIEYGIISACAEQT